MSTEQNTTSPASHEVQTDRWIRFTQIVLGLVAGVAFFSAVVPDVRASVRSAFMKDFRMVVSTVTGDLAGDGTLYTVAKVKTRGNIYIEVFSAVSDLADRDSGEVPRLVERIELPEAKDAFFNFDGQATNLALEDINGDGKKEILAPTFDKNLVGRLNVFEYNGATRGFNRVQNSAP